MIPLVVDHCEKFSGMFNRFTIGFVLAKQSRSRTFLAVKNQVDEIFS